MQGRLERKMKIYRENVVIELTPAEIHKAYREHLYQMDKELLISKLNDFIFDDEFYRIQDKEAFYNEATTELRKNLSKYDADIEDALSSAIFPTLYKYIENEKDYDE